MIFTDTHTHLYLSDFDNDRKQIIENAIKKGVKYMFFPNIDSASIKSMLNICKDFPENCFSMIGLHPSCVKENFKEELKNIDNLLKEKTHNFFAIGEIGIDLYWEKSFAKLQEIAFKRQIDLALKYKLPIVIHSSNSFDKIFKIIDDFKNSNLKGIFHCFTGTIAQANKVINLGFKLGIGGIITFKNSDLDNTIRYVDLKNIVLETDSPYLAPVPYRGKRNESSYLYYIAKKIAEIKNISIEKVAEITTNNANEVFKFI